jgi:hypothetical protein
VRESLGVATAADLDGAGHAARWLPTLLVIFLVGGGAASRWLPCGGSLGPWVVVVHNEEETVIQLVKRMRMPSSAATPAGVIVIVGGDGGGVSQSITSLDPREATIDGGASAVHIPCWWH